VSGDQGHWHYRRPSDPPHYQQAYSSYHHLSIWQEVQGCPVSLGLLLIGVSRCLSRVKILFTSPSRQSAMKVRSCLTRISSSNLSYTEMVENMKRVASSNQELTIEERNLPFSYHFPHDLTRSREHPALLQTFRSSNLSTSLQQLPSPEDLTSGSSLSL
jgi:hypothetical protein